VLAGGIGRLYFERQQQQGRILWSQNGVLQSVLEDLPLSAFQGIVNELKRLTNLPLTTVEEPKQVELERLYQEHRLLLRLRVMPGVHGEEATLQVLRGAALKFYQQQQLTRLSRDAVGIAQQLRHKLNELRERVNVNPSLNSNQVEALVTLNQLLENLDQQMKVLSSSTEPPKSIK
jgi:type II secretory ATPase GspE/PulE/Tfp pilus assembly ATPase PilB-like protein